MPTEKIERALDLISAELVQATKPILCSSFGKDSLVLMDLVYTLKKVPVLFFPQHAKQFPEKYAFASSFITSLGLEVWSLPAQGISHVQDGEYFEIFSRYGGETTGPLNMSLGCRPWTGHDKNFVCAAEMLLQPPHAHVEYPWDVTFIGTKAADPNPLAPHVEFLGSVVQSGSTRLCLPLADWTDEEVWAYIKAREMPYDRERYDQQSERTNPDQYPVCFACLDTRKRGEKVFCPVLESYIANRAMPDAWHAEQKLILLQSVSYAKFRVTKPVDPELEQKFLAQEEQWPLWSMTKRVFDDQVFVLIEDLVDISQAPNGLAKLREEWIRLERRCAEAGITGWIAWVAKENRRMQRCLFTTGATVYGEDDERIWVRKFVNPAQQVFPSLREMAKLALEKEQAHV